jgi:hypothetical protein
MTEHLKKRLTALEKRILPTEPGLPHDELNWMLTTYAECDSELQKYPNYAELNTKMTEDVLQWYGEWQDLWLKASEEEKKKLLAAIHSRIREEFLKIKSNQGDKLPCLTSSTKQD